MQRLLSIITSGLALPFSNMFVMYSYVLYIHIPLPVLEELRSSNPTSSYVLILWALWNQSILMYVANSVSERHWHGIIKLVHYVICNLWWFLLKSRFTSAACESSIQCMCMLWLLMKTWETFVRFMIIYRFVCSFGFEESCKYSISHTSWFSSNICLLSVKTEAYEFNIKN